MLHKDLFHEISLYCKPYLFSINKELHSLYKDDWFKIFLQNKYPRKKLFTTTNYVDLYKKHLSEGTIYFVENKQTFEIKTNGIKACYDSFTIFKGLPSNYILTFNGELYLETKNKITFIDDEVIDVCMFGYIKGKKFHVLLGAIRSPSLEFDNNLLKVFIC